MIKRHNIEMMNLRRQREEIELRKHQQALQGTKTKTWDDDEIPVYKVTEQKVGKKIQKPDDDENFDQEEFPSLGAAVEKPKNKQRSENVKKWKPIHEMTEEELEEEYLRK